MTRNFCQGNILKITQTLTIIDIFLQDNNHNLVCVVEIRMKSAAAGKTRFFDPPRMIFAA
jgi:hypothetical protein